MFFNIFSGFILGVVQGITEFLPISSSGHLIIVRDVLGLAVQNSLLFDVLLHLATALAIIIYFRKDILEILSFKKSQRVLLLSIVLGTIPAVIVGILFEDSISTVLRSPIVVVYSLCAGSALFFFAEWKAKQEKKLEVSRGIGVGLFQVLALIPGFSRSGATISGGLIFGLTREEAARFSFLLGIPIMLGAGLLEIINSFEIIKSGGLSIDMFVGGLTAFIVGLFVIHFLLRFLRNHSLSVFAWYRIVLAMLLVMFVV